VQSATANLGDTFEALSQIDCSKYVEKKGRFSYISWAWAVRMLCHHVPDANWEVVRFNGMPYLETPLGFFVEVAVTCKGVRKSQIHPVLDQSNKPKAKPTVFDINTSIQRALVKAIALHGLGLYIYAGEDLPTGEEKPQEEDVAAKIASGDHKPASGVMESLTPDQQMHVKLVASLVKNAFESGNQELAYNNWNGADMSADEKVAAWDLLDSKMRSTLKKMRAERTNMTAEQA
jgi:hypothetical protein